MRQRTPASPGFYQGLATSVTLAELFLSSFLLKIHTLLPVRATRAPQVLREVLHHLWLFAAKDFSLHSLEKKTRSDKAELDKIASEWNLTVADQVDTLGGSWTSSQTVDMEHRRELKRYEHLAERLRRLKHLPTTLILKASVLSAGCLSLLDYLPLPFFQEGFFPTNHSAGFYGIDTWSSWDGFLDSFFLPL